MSDEKLKTSKETAITITPTEIRNKFFENYKDNLKYHKINKPNQMAVREIDIKGKTFYEVDVNPSKNGQFKNPDFVVSREGILIMSYAKFILPLVSGEASSQLVESIPFQIKRVFGGDKYEITDKKSGKLIDWFTAGCEATWATSVAELKGSEEDKKKLIDLMRTNGVIPVATSSLTISGGTYVIYFDIKDNTFKKTGGIERTDGSLFGSSTGVKGFIDAFKATDKHDQYILGGKLGTSGYNGMFLESIIPKTSNLLFK